MTLADKASLQNVSSSHVPSVSGSYPAALENTFA